MKKLKIAIALISVLSMCLAVSCTSSNKPSTTSKQIITVSRGNISSTLTPTGNLQMPHQSKLSFGIAGTVNQTYVKMGDSVQQGQMLAKLDDATAATLQQAVIQAQMAITTAQIAIQQAEQALETAQTLTYNSNGTLNIPDPINVSNKKLALDNTKTNLDTANSNLITAQNNISLATLSAPYAGIIAEVNVNVGDKVAAATQIMRIVDPTQLQVTALVNETDIFNVSVGLSATVTVAALTSAVLPATVTAISPSATVQGGVVSYNVQLTVTQGTALNASLSGQRQGPTPATIPGGTAGRTNNGTASNNISSAQRQGQGQLPSGLQGQLPSAGSFPGLGAATDNQTLRDILGSRLTDNQTSITMTTLKEGLSVNVVITIKQDTNVILVPSKAVTRQGGNNVVQVLNSDNTTQARVVTVGLSDYSNKEITSGLTDGEKIVITTTTAATTTSTATPTTPGNSGFQIPGLGGGSAAPQIGR